MPRRALILLLTLLALVPAACGGGGEDDVPAGERTSTQEAPVDNERPDQTAVPGPNDSDQQQREEGRE